MADELGLLGAMQLSFRGTTAETIEVPTESGGTETVNKPRAKYLWWSKTQLYASDTFHNPVLRTLNVGSDRPKPKQLTDVDKPAVGMTGLSILPHVVPIDNGRAAYHLRGYDISDRVELSGSQRPEELLPCNFQPMSWTPSSGASGAGTLYGKVIVPINIVRYYKANSVTSGSVRHYYYFDGGTPVEGDYFVDVHNISIMDTAIAGNAFDYDLFYPGINTGIPSYGLYSEVRAKNNTHHISTRAAVENILTDGEWIRYYSSGDAVHDGAFKPIAVAAVAQKDIDRGYILIPGLITQISTVYSGIDIRKIVWASSSELEYGSGYLACSMVYISNLSVGMEVNFKAITIPDIGVYEGNSQAYVGFYNRHFNIESYVQTGSHPWATDAVRMVDGSQPAKASVVFDDIIAYCNSEQLGYLVDSNKADLSFITDRSSNTFDFTDCKETAKVQVSHGSTLVTAWTGFFKMAGDFYGSYGNPSSKSIHAVPWYPQWVSRTLIDQAIYPTPYSRLCEDQMDAVKIAQRSGLPVVCHVDRWYGEVIVSAKVGADNIEGKFDKVYGAHCAGGHDWKPQYITWIDVDENLTYDNGYNSNGIIAKAIGLPWHQNSVYQSKQLVGIFGNTCVATLSENTFSRTSLERNAVKDSIHSTTPKKMLCSTDFGVTWVEVSNSVCASYLQGIRCSNNGGLFLVPMTIGFNGVEDPMNYGYENPPFRIDSGYHFTAAPIRRHFYAFYTENGRTFKALPTNELFGTQLTHLGPSVFASVCRAGAFSSTDEFMAKRCVVSEYKSGLPRTISYFDTGVPVTSITSASYKTRWTHAMRKAVDPTYSIPSGQDNEYIWDTIPAGTLTVDSEFANRLVFESIKPDSAPYNWTPIIPAWVAEILVKCTLPPQEENSYTRLAVRVIDVKEGTTMAPIELTLPDTWSSFMASPVSPNNLGAKVERFRGDTQSLTAYRYSNQYTISVGTPFQVAIQCSGGDPPYKWTATGLPALTSARAKADHWAVTTTGTGVYTFKGNTPVFCEDVGTFSADWILVFDTNEAFHINGVVREGNDILAKGVPIGPFAGTVNSDLRPTWTLTSDPDHPVPYFSLPKDGWSGSWHAGDRITFKTYAKVPVLKVEESGVLSGTPTQDLVGNHQIQFTVTDSAMPVPHTANYTLNLLIG